MRVLVGSDATVASPVFVGADGETPTATTGTPTCTVTRDDGTVLAAPTVTNTGVGTFTAALLHGTHTTRLDLLTLTWTGVVAGVTQVYSDTVEVVGAFYCTLAEIRAAGNGALANTTKYPSSLLRATRDEFQDLAERYCGQAFVPRYQRDVLAGPGWTRILLTMPYPRTLIAASATDNAGTVTTFSVTNWRLDQWGTLITDGDLLPFTIYGAPNITVAYTHGLDHPPAEIVRACKLYCQWQLLRDSSQVGRDIRQGTDPAGFSTTYSLPDWDAGRPTGIGEIDTALNAVGRRPPGVA